MQKFLPSLRQLLRLPITTPESFVMFLAGSLPATAIVHLRTLTLLGMISRLGPTGILNKIGRDSLLTASNKGSWFLAVRRTTQQYGLPDPLIVLQQPLPKCRWKSLCKGMVMKWWEAQYRGEAQQLESLAFFDPNFYSLTRPHRILTSAGSQYEVSRASVVVLMLSGRYICDYRTRHFDLSNPTGACRLCRLSPGAIGPPGTLEHQLLQCPALQPVYSNIAKMWRDHLATRPWLQPVVFQHCQGPLQGGVQFLLDPSSWPAVIRAAQELGQVVYYSCHLLGRAWCYAVHTARMKMLKHYGYL